MSEDFVREIDNLKEFPEIWYVLGVDELNTYAEIVVATKMERRDKINVVRIAGGDDSGDITFLDEHDDGALKDNKPVLVLAGIVSTGQALLSVVRRLNERGCDRILTYALVVKATSSVIPNYYGLMIRGEDTAYFGRVALRPRSVLSANFGLFRVLNRADIQRKPNFVDSGLGSINYSFGQLYYEMISLGCSVYVFEQSNKIVGVLKFLIKENELLLVDLVIVDRGLWGKSIGSAFMRWVEEYAKIRKCKGIELFAVEDKISFYERHGYGRTEKKVDFGDGEVVHSMIKLLELPIS